MMKSISRWVLIVALGLASVLSLVILPGLVAPPQVVAEEKEGGEVAQEKLRNEQKKLESRLDEIKKQLQKAREDGDEAKVRKLREEVERILKRADQIASMLPRREEERQREPEERRELQRHRFRLETERLELEVQAMRLELSKRLTEIASNKDSSVAYAISRVQETMEAEQAIPFLEGLLKESRHPTTQRMIRIKLAQLYRHHDRSEDAKKQLRALILSK